MIHPSPDRIRQLTDRWNGQAERLERIAESMLVGEDWTVHLRGLPLVEEIPPRDGEAYGRDLRGAQLRSLLHPKISVARATEKDAALVASLTLEGLENNTPLPGVTPFPVDVESADGIQIAMRKGDRFLLARAAKKAVGVVRWAARREFAELSDDREYGEISGLAVAITHRRFGVGSTLLASAEWDVAAQGHDVALLRTAMEVGLVHWYEARGYALKRVRQFTYPGAPTFLDAILTKKLAVIGGHASRG